MVLRRCVGRCVGGWAKNPSFWENFSVGPNLEILDEGILKNPPTRIWTPFGTPISTNRIHQMCRNARLHDGFELNHYILVKLKVTGGGPKVILIRVWGLTLQKVILIRVRGKVSPARWPEQSDSSPSRVR